MNAGRAPERRGVGEIGAPTPLPPALGCIAGYRRVIKFSVIGKPLQDVYGQAYPTPACGGRDRREGVNPCPRLRGRGLRAKREGGGGIQLQDVYGQAYPTPACGGRDGREERPSEGGGKSPPPLAGEGTPSEARRGRGISAAVCLRPGISHPRLRGKGREGGTTERGRG